MSFAAFCEQLLSTLWHHFWHYYNQTLLFLDRHVHKQRVFVNYKLIRGLLLQCGHNKISANGTMPARRRVNIYLLLTTSVVNTIEVIEYWRNF